MAEILFANFNEEYTRLKIVRMKEILYGAEPKIQLEGCDALNESMIIKKSQNPEPTLKHIRLVSGEDIHLWRTSFCVYHPRTGTWIHILDSDKPRMIPGEFTYKEEYLSALFSSSKSAACIQRKREIVDIIHKIGVALLPTVPVPVPSIQPPSRSPLMKVPLFVGKIIKRDAIQNKDRCAIMLDEFTEDMKTCVTPCFHIFTESGMSAWLESKNQCPTCKCDVQQSSCLFV